MASSAVALTAAVLPARRAGASFSPLRMSPPKAAAPPRAKSASRAALARASLKEKAAAGLTAAALAAASAVPDVAEAAQQPGLSPSLKNFLLSIAAGGVVLVVLVGAVIGVANFDPVKRS